MLKRKTAHWKEILKKLFRTAHKKPVLTRLQVEELRERIVPATVWNPSSAAADGSTNSLRADISAAEADTTSSVEQFNLSGAYILSIANSNTSTSNGASFTLIGTPYANLYDSQNQSGDLNIFSSSPKTFIFTGSGSNTIIEQTVADRVFGISGSSVTVMFNDVTIEGGKAVGDGTQVSASADVASRINSEGGGVLVQGGATVDFTNAVIKNNEAIAAGGGYQGGTSAAFPTKGSFTSEPAAAGQVATSPGLPAGDGKSSNSNGLNAYGGGLYVANGTVTLSGGTQFIHNSAIAGAGQNGGAGGYVGFNSVVTGSTAAGAPLYGHTKTGTGPAGNGGNGANGGTAAGGGIYMASGTLVIGTSSSGNVALTGNVAKGGEGGAGGAGGDVYLNERGSKGLAGNAGLGGIGGLAFGGGLYIQSGTVTFGPESTLDSNKALGGAGGEGGAAGSSDNKSGLGGNGGAGGAGGAALGGAIWNGSGSITLTSSTLDGNQAIGGMGGDAQNGGAEDRANGMGGEAGSTGGNGGAALGGAIWTNTGTLTLTSQSHVDQNGAYGGNGGMAGSGGYGGNSTGSNGVGGNGGEGGAGGNAQGGAVYSQAGTVSIAAQSTANSNDAFGGDGVDGGNGGKGKIVGGNGGAGGAGGSAEGGGIWAGGGSSGTSVTVTGQSSVSNNGANAGKTEIYGFGGAGGNGGAGLLQSGNGSPGGNGGTGFGGGIFAADGVTISNLSLLNGNEAVGATGGAGGHGSDHTYTSHGNIYFNDLTGGRGGQGGTGGAAAGGGVYVATGAIGVTSSTIDNDTVIAESGGKGGYGGNGMKNGGAGGAGGGAGTALGGGLFDGSTFATTITLSISKLEFDNAEGGLGGSGGDGGNELSHGSNGLGGIGGNGGNGGQGAVVKGGGIYSIAGSVTVQQVSVLTNDNAVGANGGNGGNGGSADIKSGVAGKGGTGGVGDSAAGGGIYTGSGKVTVTGTSVVGQLEPGLAIDPQDVFSENTDTNAMSAVAGAGGDGGNGGAAFGANGAAGLAGAGGNGGSAQGGGVYAGNGLIVTLSSDIYNGKADGGDGGNGGNGGAALKNNAGEAAFGGAAGVGANAAGGAAYVASGSISVTQNSAVEEGFATGGDGGNGGNAGEAENGPAGKIALGAAGGTGGSAFGGLIYGLGSVAVMVTDSLVEFGLIAGGAGGNAGDDELVENAAQGAVVGAVGGAGGAAQGGAIWTGSGAIAVGSAAVATRETLVGLGYAFGGAGGAGGSGGGAGTKGVGGAGGSGGLAQGGGISTGSGTITITASSTEVTVISDFLAKGGTGGKGGKGVSLAVGGNGGTGGAGQGGNIDSGSGSIILNSTATLGANGQTNEAVIIENGKAEGSQGGSGGTGGAQAAGGVGGAGGIGAGGGIWAGSGNVTATGVFASTDGTPSSGAVVLASDSAKGGLGGAGGKGGAGPVLGGTGGQGGHGLGAGLYSGTGSVTFSYTYVSGNHAEAGNGGEGGEAQIGGTGGSGGNALGGGAYIAAGSSLSLSESVVEDNIVGYFTSGTHSDPAHHGRGGAGGSGPSAGTGGTGGNTSGGGLYVLAGGNVIVTTSSIVSNTVEAAGTGGNGGGQNQQGRGGNGGNASAGGIYAAAATKFTISTIGDNTVGAGGAPGKGSTTVTHPASGTSSAGGMATAAGANVSLISVTLAFNSDEYNQPNPYLGTHGSDLGGGLNNAGILTLTSTLIADNTTINSVVPPVTVTESDLVNTGTVTGISSLIQGLSTGAASIGGISNGVNGNQVGVPKSDAVSNGVVTKPGVDLDPTLYIKTNPENLPAQPPQVTTATPYFTFYEMKQYTGVSTNTSIDSLAINNGTNPASNNLTADQIGDEMNQNAPVDVGAINIPSEPASSSQFVAVGTSNGYVEVINQETGATLQYFQPFPGYSGAVTVAVGDLFGSANGSVDDLIVSGGGFVIVYNGEDVLGGGETSTLINLGNSSTFEDGSNPTGNLNINPISVIAGLPTQETSPVLVDIQPFANYTGPLNITVGDVNGDGFEDIIIGGGEPIAKGKPAEVAVYSGANPSKLLGKWTPFAGYTGGLTITSGDLTSTTKADVIVGDGSQVKVYTLVNSVAEQLGATITTAANSDLQLTAFNPTGKHSSYEDLAIGTLTNGVTTVRVYSINVKDYYATTLLKKYTFGTGLKSFALTAYTASVGQPDALLFDGIAVSDGQWEVLNALSSGTATVENHLNNFPAVTGGVSVSAN